MIKPNSAVLNEWIDHLFNHPVMEPAWYWSEEVKLWKDRPSNILAMVADTFENSGTLLNRFSDGQLHQGFTYLLDNGISGSMHSLKDRRISIKLRIRVVKSFVPLFESIMAKRCSPHLGSFSEKSESPLNGSCYMWWDILPIFGQPDDIRYAEFDAAVLEVLKELLLIPHDACRESALHGIGHWVFDYPMLAEVVDQFVDSTPNLRDELRSYAELAREGMVM